MVRISRNMAQPRAQLSTPRPAPTPLGVTRNGTPKGLINVEMIVGTSRKLRSSENPVESNGRYRPPDSQIIGAMRAMISGS